MCSVLEFLSISLHAQNDKIVNLIIDIGNTVAKVALFEGATMVNVVYDSNESLDCLEHICTEYPDRKSVV